MGLGALILSMHIPFLERFGWMTSMIAVTGIGIILFSLTRNPWMGAGALALIGLPAVMILVPMDTFLQKHVEDACRGRVFAVRGIFYGTGFLLSLQFSKSMIHHWGVLKTLQGLGVACIFLAIASTWAGRKLRIKN